MKMFLSVVEVETALNKLNDDLKLFQEVRFVDAQQNKQSSVPGAFDSLSVCAVDFTGFAFNRVFSGCISIYDLRAFFGEYLEQFNQRMVGKLLGG